MKELSLHIERLLLQHDCVVVPHFGAFVARDTVATHSDQEEIFFPPSRLVRFNPEISVYGILQARILQWVAIPLSRAFS